MLDSDPTPTQVRHLQNKLEALPDEKQHRSALKEGAKSWSWNKAKERLREKRRAFDHQLVDIYSHSPVPTPDDLYGRFDEVWESKVENDLVKSVKKEIKAVAGGQAVGGIAGAALGTLGGAAVGGYLVLVTIANKRWQSYCEECVRIAKEEAGNHLDDQESSG
jgi:hypothetical protein